MYAVIWFQNFSLQAVLRMERFEAESAIAILRETIHRSIIYQVNSIAARYGVKEGHTVSQALAKCKHLQVRPIKPLAEKSAKHTIFSCLYALTPFIEESAYDRYTIRLSGIPAAQQKTRIRQLFKSLRKAGFFPQIGVAATVDWAHYAAKCASPLLWVEDASDFFKEVSIRIAVDDEQMRQILQQWGIHTLGEFADLPMQAVAKRLGKDGLTLWQSLHSGQQRILEIAHPPQEYEAGIEMEYEIETLEPLLFILNRLIEQLCLQLKCAFMQAKVLIFELRMDDGGHYRRVFKLPEPTTRQDKLRQVLETHLENLHTSSAIKAVAIEAVPTEAVDHQPQLFQHSVKDIWKFSSTLHQLIGLVGSENVGTPQLQDDHLPDSFRMEAPVQVLEKVAPPQISLTTKPALRLQRFRPSLPASVQLRKGKPVTIQSGFLEGRIRDRRGPWHLSGTWWDPRYWKRVEWDVELEDGPLLRIVFTQGRWFIEGSYG